MEEAQNKKQELRENVNAWKKKHPEWLNSEAMETAKSKLTPRTYQGYTSVLPIFCYFMDKTPQQIIEEREQHYKSDDRKIRYFYEDKLEEFRQFLVEHHYGARTIKAYLGRVAGLFSNNRLDLLLDKSFWAKSNKISSDIAQAIQTTKRYPDNDEMRLIVELADNQQALGILFGYHCGLTHVLPLSSYKLFRNLIDLTSLGLWRSLVNRSSLVCISILKGKLYPVLSVRKRWNHLIC